MRAQTTCALLTAAVLAMIACGGGDKAPSPDVKAADPAASQSAATATASGQKAELSGCAWVTEAEGTAALGKPMKYRSNDPGSSNCILDDAATDVGISVDFTVGTGSGSYDYTAGLPKVDTLTGVGDRAVWSGDAMISTLAVVKGSREFQIVISDPTRKATDVREKAIALAKVIMTKM